MVRTMLALRGEREAKTHLRGLQRKGRGGPQALQKTLDGEKTPGKTKTRAAKKKPTTDYKEKYQGKFYFNSQRIKSKSELLICYFLTANQIQFQYETPLFINDQRYRPDFVLDDGKGHLVILEHFGGDGQAYLKRKRTKIKEYTALCNQSPEFHFVWTDEEDIYNLKERLGDKLNRTPLKKPLWK